jgi:hypothetical protein
MGFPIDDIHNALASHPQQRVRDSGLLSQSRADEDLQVGTLRVPAQWLKTGVAETIDDRRGIRDDPAWTVPAEETLREEEDLRSVGGGLQSELDSAPDGALDVSGLGDLADCETRHQEASEEVRYPRITLR